MIEFIILSCCIGFLSGIFGAFLYNYTRPKTIKTKTCKIEYLSGYDNDFITVCDKYNNEKLFMSISKTINGINSFKYAIN